MAGSSPGLQFYARAYQHFRRRRNSITERAAPLIGVHASYLLRLTDVVVYNVFLRTTGQLRSTNLHMHLCLEWCRHPL
jgi:hypothetical protein